MNETFKFHLEQVTVFAIMCGTFLFNSGMSANVGSAVMFTWIVALAAVAFVNVRPNTACPAFDLACVASGIPLAVAIFISESAHIAVTIIVLAISLVIGYGALDEIKKSGLSYGYALFWLIVEFSVIAGPMLYFIWKYQEQVKVVINF